ncbi:MAG TPA: hypothetical protein VNF72_07810 [Myxococcota bacterium]|jgi:hypothetical protein|nr:hypothetical protein [Myxococcota bacterium]
MSEANQIATSSIEEALDFAFNLLMGPIAATGRANPQLAVELLEQIENFVHPRYVGELEIALEYIEHFASLVRRERLHHRDQFARQLEWLRERIPR